MCIECNSPGFGVLFDEARKVTLDIGQKEEYLISLEKSLPQIDIVKCASIAHAKKLQEQLEMTYLAIKQKETRVKKSTSKESLQFVLTLQLYFI